DYLKSVSERFGDYDELLILAPSGQVVATTGERATAVELPGGWQARLRGADCRRRRAHAWHARGRGRSARSRRNAADFRARRLRVGVAADGGGQLDRELGGRVGRSDAAPLSA